MLQETLNEEEETDNKLTQIAQTTVNPDSMETEKAYDEERKGSLVR